MYRKMLLIVVLVFFSKLLAQPIAQSYQFNQPPSQDPTNFDVIKPENVLVVYKRPNNENDALGNISQEIKDYYVGKRGIPQINVVKGADGNSGLLLPNIEYYNGESVILDQEGEIIRRNHICSRDSFNGVCDNLAFYYYYEKIAQPISNYLNNTIDPNTGNYLKDQIHYIVLCKGIPLKIKSADYGWLRYWQSYHISIDGLLCLLKTNNNNNPSIMSLYPPTTNIYYNCRVENPYNGIDLSFNFNHRFKSNHYFVNKILNDGTEAQFKVSCLVSRLDGRNVQEIKNLIDNSFIADKSGAGTWVLDGHFYIQADDPENYQAYNSYNQNTIAATASKLTQYGFNVYFDGTSLTPIYSYNEPVISYLSWGRHAGYPIGFIVNNLSFNLLAGSIYNTIESYNGTSMYSAYRTNEQSLLSEYIQIDGTSGAGHTYEPYLGPNNNPYNFFPAYAMGYNVVEAAYQGIQFLAWQNIVVGDPLTTIAWGKQTLTQNITWAGTNLVTGIITVPSGKTLTIQNNSTIRLRHLGIVGGAGILNIGSNVTINTNDWSRSVLLSNSGFNPRLVWAAHPSISTTNFKVYRAISSTQVSDPSTLTYQLIYTSPNASTFSFTDIDIAISTGSYVYYYVTAFMLINPRTGYGVESGRSNYASVRGDMYKRSYENATQTNQELDYSLEQNYPNPFNPYTQIKYSLKEDAIVALKVFDILGNEITTLVNEPKGQGSHFVDVNSKNLSSGVYIYQLKANNYIASMKMIITK
jgi:uncharacterized protein (TIGR03790 family)